MRLRFLDKIISPFWRWSLVLVLLPILELFLLLNFVSSVILYVSMFVSGLIGVLFARREGLRSWRELNRQLDNGRTPTQPILHGVLILLGAALMILPGLLSSLVGLFLLLPLFRSFVVAYLVLHFEAHRLRTQTKNTSHPPEIIDV